MWKNVALISVFMFSLENTALAEVTPSHVFQSAKHLQNIVDVFHVKNFTKPGVAEVNPILRKPRHVYNAALIVLKKINNLRYINGLEIVKRPPLPDDRIIPADVKKIVDLARTSMEELYPAYNIETPIEQPAFVDQKKPQDVYTNLTIIQSSLDNLGIVKTIPNDVFQLAAELHSEVEILAKHLSVQTDTSSVHVEGNITPVIVYDGLLKVREDLSYFTKRKNIEIPGGVAEVTTKPVIINPGRVESLLSTTLADIREIKEQLDIRESIEIDTYSGKTPKDVLQKLSESGFLISKL